MTTLFTCMIYDREDYAGGRVPESVMPSNGPRFGVVIVAVDPVMGWTKKTLLSARVETRDEALALVPSGGLHRDRSTNFPSPMVPTDSWDYDHEPPWREEIAVQR